MKKIDRFLLLLLPLPFTTLGLKVFTFSGFYMPEVFFICFGFFLLFSNYNKIIKEIIMSKIFLVTLFIFLGISIFSLGHNDFNIFQFYGRFRAFFFSILAFSVVLVANERNWNERFLDCLGVFCFSACVMYLVSAILSSNDESSKIGVSMLCYSICIVLMIEKNKIVEALIVSLMAIAVAYLSFFRQNYFISGYLLVLVMFFLVFKFLNFNRDKGSIYINKDVIYSCIVLILFCFLIVINYDSLYGYLTSSESKYIQSIGKFNDLIYSVNNSSNNDISSDLRVKSYGYLLSNFSYFFLPNGLIDDSLLTISSIWGGESEYLGMSIVRDSIFAYMIVTFGFLLFVVMVYVYLINIYISLIKRFKIILLRSMFLIPTLLLLFFVDGATLTQLQKSIFFGIAIALLISPNLFYVKNK